MYIKLSFSAGKSACQIFRVVADIINNQSITSIAALRTRESAAPYAADLLLNLQDSYSYIYRTNNPSNTIAYMVRSVATAGSTTYNLIIRQPIYDSPTSYIHTNIYDANATTDYIQYKPVTISSGDPTIAANQWSISESSTQSSVRGTVLTTADIIANGTTIAPASSIYTAHIYITDYCILFCMDTLGVSKSANFNNTNSSLNPCMPAGQYKRYDYWNTQANGIYPVVTDTHNGGGLFSTASHYGSIQNPVSVTAAECMLKMTHYIIAYGSANTTWTVTKDMRVIHGLGTRYADIYALSSAGLGTANGPGTATYGAALYSATTYNQYRAPMPNLNTRGYTLFPLTFRNLYYCIVGGNITEICNYYIYHGEYSAGDEISYNGKTYVIWPVGSNPPSTSRIGIAVPKE